MKIIAQYHQHVDNGGVSMQIEDHDAGGLILVTEAAYYGYPAILTQMRVDSLGSEWLRKIGEMFLEAASANDKIDWASRFDKL